MVLVVVPLFGVAAGLVPVSASAATAARAATVAASVLVGRAPAAPAKPSDNFWTYETNHHLSTISEDNDYDFSAKMTNEVEKVTREAIAKKITKISLWLSLLANAINAFVHNHPHAAAIAGFLAAVVAVVGAKKVAAVWKWLRGIIYKGKHRRSGVARNGFWAEIFTAETSPPRHYAGWRTRTCSTDSIKCGSPGDHNKENWPSP
jgi:hypothetical protein